MRSRPPWVCLTVLVLALASCRDRTGDPSPAGDAGSGSPGGQTGEPAAPPCTPRTCFDARAACGPADDGCGGVLDCGTCPEGSCVLGRDAQVCAMELPARSPAWSWLGPSLEWDGLGGIADGARGDVLVLWYSSLDDAVALDRVGCGGATAIRRWPVTGGTRSIFRGSPNLRREPDGTLLVEVTPFAGLSQDTYVDLGGGARTGTQIVALREDGSYLRTALTCCPFFEMNEWIEDVDSAGNMLVGFWSTGDRGSRLIRADGQVVVLSSFDIVTEAQRGLDTGCDSPRFTLDGNVVCGGQAVVKVNLDGRVLWTATPGGSGLAGWGMSLGVTARGTIVVAGASAVGGFYAALEPDGAVRFVRHVVPGPIALAVDPAGRAAMLLSAWSFSKDADLVYANLDGDLLWRAPLPRAQRVAFAGGQIIAAGSLDKGSHDLGSGPWEVGAPAVYVVAFDP